jgi:hypothetical protein
VVATRTALGTHPLTRLHCARGGDRICPVGPMLSDLEPRLERKTGVVFFLKELKRPPRRPAAARGRAVGNNTYPWAIISEPELGASMPQPTVGNSDSLSDLYAILEAQAPALPYELDPRFHNPVICKRVGDLIARATIPPSRPARGKRADPRPRPRFYVSKFAHDLALPYLACRDVSPTIRKQLREVVEGYTGRCDEAAARAGIEWMRDKSRARDETPRSYSEPRCTDGPNASTRQA